MGRPRLDEHSMLVCPFILVHPRDPHSICPAKGFGWPSCDAAALDDVGGHPNDPGRHRPEVHDALKLSRGSLPGPFGWRMEHGAWSMEHGQGSGAGGLGVALMRSGGAGACVGESIRSIEFILHARCIDREESPQADPDGPRFRPH